MFRAPALHAPFTFFDQCPSFLGGCGRDWAGSSPVPPPPVARTGSKTAASGGSRMTRRDSWISSFSQIRLSAWEKSTGKHRKLAPGTTGMPRHLHPKTGFRGFWKKKRASSLSVPWFEARKIGKAASGDGPAGQASAAASVTRSFCRFSYSKTMQEMGKGGNFLEKSVYKMTYSTKQDVRAERFRTVQSVRTHGCGVARTPRRRGYSMCTCGRTMSYYMKNPPSLHARDATDSWFPPLPGHRSSRKSLLSRKHTQLSTYSENPSKPADERQKGWIFRCPDADMPVSMVRREP